MNCDETLKIIEALRVSGAVRFKAPGLELEFGGAQQVATTSVVQPAAHTPNVVPTPPQADNADKIQRLIDLLKKNDEQLMNEIFPAGA